jgi:ATP-binding cassette, subfamily B, bacterial
MKDVREGTFRLAGRRHSPRVIRLKKDDIRRMDDITRFANKPLAFIARCVARYRLSHVAILCAVLAAVGCSVSTQYGIKFLVDTLNRGVAYADTWTALALLVSLIAADNLLWRVASFIAAHTFVAVTGNVRRELFSHLTGHAPAYFADRLPGSLTGRIAAASNAVFAIENMFLWNALPPCIATAVAIGYLAIVSLKMMAAAAGIAGVVVFLLFRLAAAGAPLHRRYADDAAAVDGEMADVVGNITLVHAFGALRSEQVRIDRVVGREMTARRRSLRYLERLRLFHALTTVLVTAMALAWALVLWRQGRATTGDVVLVSTLGFTILYSTRDLAIAMVDMTQHVARLQEALATLLQPYMLRDSPGAPALRIRDGRIDFENLAFAYAGRPKTFDGFNLSLAAGARTGLVGPSGGGKSTLFALLQRFHDPQSGQIRIDGQNIAAVTQQSLRAAIAVVPQDISMLHRSVLENIRYGRPGASDAEVRNAAEAARCAEFIALLPEQFNTVVGERGVKLSSGQRQRIAIARALLKNAPILLLDEATSALDTESEEAVRSALNQVMRGRTVFAIAHRLSTLRSFDRVVVLQGGRVVQDGAPRALMKVAGPYRDLVERELARLDSRAA